MPRRRPSLASRVSDSFKVLTELDLSHAYERQAGTIAIAVLAAVVVVVGVATGWRLGVPRTVPVVVEFSSAPGLAGGDAVQIAGVTVGRVTGIELAEPGRVRVTLAVRPQLAPRRDATAELVALDLVGSQAVRYDPGTAAEPLEPGAAIPATAPPALAGLLQDLKAQAADIVIGLRSFDPEVLAADLRAVEAALARARAAAAAYPVDSLAAAAGRALSGAESVVVRLDALVAAVPTEALRVQRDSLTANLGTVSAAAAEVQETLGRIRGAIARGEGNLGRLRQDSTLRREIDATRESLRLLQEKYLGRPKSAAR
jgi:phospholipid/cholesterol/gamma-HCH transport system substrate-binding protein